MPYILAMDQGTTSSRAIVFDGDMKPIASAAEEFPQHFPASGWVEHDPADIWRTSLSTAKAALAKAGVESPDAIGITSQRETTIIWDRANGKPVYNAIVWQDRRTEDTCATLREAGHEPMVTEKTGLLLDPYFSATKVAWILNNVEGVRTQAEAGKLAFGTVDSYLIWHLTEGKSHVTDATNAARTMLYNIHKGEWDAELCTLLNIPMSLLPEVKDSAADFGHAEALGAPVLGVAGDQQAATIGQACFAPGMMKSTYGTGCFALLNTGSKPVTSTNRLLTTIAYQLEGKPTYALEGSIFIAGAVVQWLRDGLGIIQDASETQALAEAADPAQQLYLVPAFTGLGAPYWDANCRGAIYGLTRASGPADFAKAALESVAYQTRDLVEAMRGDWADAGETVLRVDGGMCNNAWAMQALADVLGADVDRPEVLESTAFGVAWLAGMRAGIYPDMQAFSESWALERRFTPSQPENWRAAKYAGWKDAVARTLSKP